MAVAASGIGVAAAVAVNQMDSPTDPPEAPAVVPIETHVDPGVPPVPVVDVDPVRPAAPDFPAGIDHCPGCGLG